MREIRGAFWFLANARAFGVYVLGSASFMALDLLIATVFESERVAAWAEARAFFGISIVLALLGLDGMFVRYPEMSALLIKRLALQVPSLSLALSVVLWVTGLASHWLLIVGLAIGGALSVAAQECLRASGDVGLAQIANQAWRIPLFFVVALAFCLDVDVSAPSMFAFIVFVNGLLVYSIIYRRFVRVREVVSSTAGFQLYSASSKFMCMSIVLAAAVHVEQLIVAQSTDAESTASYFRHTAYFVFPLMFFYSYVGFMLTPYIKRHAISGRELMRVALRYGLPASVLFSAIVNCLVSIGLALLAGDEIQTDYWLRLIFFFTGIWLGMYMFPSSFNPLFLSGSRHTRYILVQAGSLLLGGAVGLFLHFLGVSVIYAVATASSVGWLLRAMSGLLFVNEIATSHVGLSAEGSHKDA